MRLRPLQDATAGKGRAEKAVWNRTEAESFRPSVPGIPDFHSDIQLFPVRNPPVSGMKSPVAQMVADQF